MSNLLYALPENLIYFLYICEDNIMRKMTCFLACCVLLLLVNTAHGQSDETRQAILHGKALLAEATSLQDREGMQEARQLFDTLKRDPSVAALAYYYAGYASYRLSTFLPRTQTDERMAYLNEAVADLETAIQKQGDLADAYTLLDRCYGLQIDIDHSLGQTLGEVGEVYRAHALQLAPDNPRVLFLSGAGLYFTPPEYGGDPQLAMEHFEQAAQLFETQTPSDPLLPDWGHAEVYAWIGQGYLIQNPEEAHAALTKALTLDPDYRWVKERLLPQAEAQLKKQP